MELEGFGVSLTGRTLFVCCPQEEAWIPWEFLGQHTTRILVTTEYSPLEVEHPWTAIVRPATNRDWSCVATMARTDNALIVLTHTVPESFRTFLHTLPITRIWVGQEIPTIPDAVFFPVRSKDAYAYMTRLPGRNGHGQWTMTVAEYEALVAATVASGLGLVISDLGAPGWTLYWHKLADSLPAGSMKRGLAAIRAGVTIVEKHSPS